MGNTFSQRNAVILQTEKQTYFDGDVVEGLVCLNLVDPLDVSSIECQLQGLEGTDFGEGPDLGRLDQFLSSCCTLPDTERRLEPGQYQWCFVLRVPKGSRSTYREEEGAGGKAYKCAKVEYMVNAYVAKRDKRGGEVAALTHSLPLVVHKRAKLAAVASIERAADETVTRWCCIHEGSIRVRAVVERCTYLPGEEMAVRVEVDNQSPRRIEAVEMALRHMTWLRLTKQLDEHERRHIEWFYVAPNGMPVDLFSQEDRLPDEMQPTYVGSCITSKYFVTIKLRMGRGTGDVNLSVPITTLPPQPSGHGRQLPDCPDFWRPQLMGGPVAIKVSGQPDLLGKFDWSATAMATLALKIGERVLDIVG